MSFAIVVYLNIKIVQPKKGFVFRVFVYLANALSNIPTNASFDVRNEA